MGRGQDREKRLKNIADKRAAKAFTMVDSKERLPRLDLDSYSRQSIAHRCGGNLNSIGQHEISSN